MRQKSAARTRNFLCEKLNFDRKGERLKEMRERYGTYVLEPSQM